MENDRILKTLATLEEELVATRAREVALGAAIAAIRNILTPPRASGAAVVSGTARVGGRRPKLKASVRVLLTDVPAWAELSWIVEQMAQRGLVGGTSQKTMTEAVRQACNQLVAQGELVKDDADYGHTRYALKNVIEPEPYSEPPPRRRATTESEDYEPRMPME